MGILESRKGLIWGPFCPVYGVGAVVLILILEYVKPKKNIKLFLYGVFIGAFVEYLLSYMLEAIYGTRFWDYKYTNSDINGRICTLYSLFWGFLAIIIMKLVKPQMDKLIEKIPDKIRRNTAIILFTFLLIDTLVTVWAVHTYETRAMKQYYGEEIIVEESDNFIISLKNKIENQYFTNERMKNTFPNLRTKDKDGKELWVRDIIK